MSFVKVLARRVLESNVRKLEQPDIWKLYHLVHFYKGFGIKGDQTFGDIPDQKTPLKEQYRIVHKHVQQQVRAYMHEIVYCKLITEFKLRTPINILCFTTHW